MNDFRLSRLTPAKREAQLRRAEAHATRPCHRNGKGTPFKGKNKSQRQRLATAFACLGNAPSKWDHFIHAMTRMS
jgi:hypothetical protein